MSEQPAGPEPARGPAAIRQLRPFAVLVGSMIDNVGTYLWSLAFLAMRGVPIQSETAEEAQQAITAVLQVSSNAAILLAIGMSFVVIGAYAAGRLTPAAPVLNGVAVSIVSLTIAIIDRSVAGPGPAPAWYTVIGYGLVIPAGFAGGLLARRRTINIPDDKQSGQPQA